MSKKPKAAILYDVLDYCTIFALKTMNIAGHAGAYHPKPMAIFDILNTGTATAVVVPQKN